LRSRPLLLDFVRLWPPTETAGHCYHAGVKIALAQINPIVGDVPGNLALVQNALRQATAAGVDLAVFPEQTLLGYPAHDLLFRLDRLEANQAALDTLARESARTCPAIIGFAEYSTATRGRAVHNAAALIADGGVHAVIRKQLLPTYDVFDEARYFEPAGPQPVIEFRGRRLGITICEDMWPETELLASRIYTQNPLAHLVAHGADLLINISASPWHLHKAAQRRKLITGHAKRHRMPMVMVNQVGANDELIFDGASCVLDGEGRIRAQAAAFEPDLLLVDIDNLPPVDERLNGAEAAGERATAESNAELRRALLLGIRDYFRKTGFRRAVLGLSGGIDSALVAALAAEALGPENVHGVALPSRFSSDHSLEDARQLAENLGIRFSVVPIEGVHKAAETALQELFAGRSPDVAEENLQARARGLLLMGLSNKFGDLLLTTGNKSEVAVGYCTLYGDMCGALAVISDVYKTRVYGLARHINQTAGRPMIPVRTLTKPPSAELRPNQTDQDTLPPYDVLDDILERYEERLESAEQIIAAGHNATTVQRVLKMIRVNEYKRYQAAPGLKVTPRAFGVGRRIPIAAR
jgi:NAD+ synthase (glutamine-hydrolysing)